MPPSSENEDPETERSASPADDKKEKTRAAATSSKQSAKRRTKTGCLSESFPRSRRCLEHVAETSQLVENAESNAAKRSP